MEEEEEKDPMTKKKEWWASMITVFGLIILAKGVTNVVGNIIVLIITAWPIASANIVEGIAYIVVGWIGFKTGRTCEI